MKEPNLSQSYYPQYLSQSCTDRHSKNFMPFHSYPNRPKDSSERFNVRQTMKIPKIFHQKEEGDEPTARERRFLRHTAYALKKDSFPGQQKSLMVPPSKFQQNNQEEEKPSNYLWKSTHSTSPNSFTRSNIKFDNYDKYKSYTPQTREPLNCNEISLKDKNKFSKQQPEFQQGNNQQNQTQDVVFKKKEFKPSFYTPKISNQNYEQVKLKRIFSPEIQIFKVSSPTYKDLKQTLSIKDFILGPQIGGGKYSSVYKALHIKTKSFYALKKIEKNMLKKSMLVDQFILEVKIQTYLKHENIIQIYGIFDDNEHIYMILEYMCNSTLYSLLKKKKKLTQNQAALKVKQMAKAVIYMHANGIVHRDIKPENVVLTGNVCKMCDFGWATICEDRRKTHCGTFDYVAPEIFQGQQYDMSVDIWCLGVIAYELMVGKPPFYHISRKQTISHIINVQQKKINYPQDMSNVAKSFISETLKKNPEQRLTLQQILKHPFLVDAKQQ